MTLKCYLNDGFHNQILTISGGMLTKCRRREDFQRGMTPKSGKMADEMKNHLCDMNHKKELNKISVLLRVTIMQNSAAIRYDQAEKMKNL